MKYLSFTDKCRVLFAGCLIKLKVLKHDQFSEAELNELIAKFFPQELAVDVPVGEATLVCHQGVLSMPQTTNKITLSLDTTFNISMVGNPIYRAHVSAKLSASPLYNVAQSKLQLIDITLDKLQLIDDEYSLVKDTSSLIKQISSISTPLQSSLSIAAALAFPVKQVVNTLTGGLSDASIHYLQSFTQSNKQKLLADHRPNIENALLKKCYEEDLSISMNDSIWREYLFKRFGKRVSVENRELKFWMT